MRDTTSGMVRHHRDADSTPAARARVAVVFGAWFKGAFNGENIRDRVLLPLDGEVHLALTYRDDDKCDSVASCGLRERYRVLQPRQLDLERQPTALELTATLESMPHWPKIFAAYRGSCVRHVDKNNKTAFYGCNLRTMKESGNTFMAPVLGKPGLHVLHELRAQSRLLRMISSFEEAHGFRYAAVVWSRLDMFWLHDHPPMDVLNVSTCSLWSPYCEDYGGIQDRHALMSRDVAPYYLGRFDFLQDGRILEIAPEMLRGQQSGQSSERFMARALRHFNVSVCRYPAFSFLQCCPNGPGEHSISTSCNAKGCTLLGKMLHTSALLKLRTYLNTSLQGVGGKYQIELTSATQHATAMLTDGARLYFDANRSKHGDWAFVRGWTAHAMGITRGSIYIRMPGATDRPGKPGGPPMVW